jgi:hypothetical protein
MMVHKLEVVQRYCSQPQFQEDMVVAVNQLNNKLNKLINQSDLTFQTEKERIWALLIINSKKRPIS